MKIGLIDVDGRHYPNLALMKISAWHKTRGDEVEWWDGFAEYDKVYMSKVFDETYTPDIPEPTNAREIIKGGTGYGLDNKLPYKVADLSEWWRGQKNIVLMDANILACPQSLQLLQQLKDSGATVDFNQGLDARLLNEENIALLGGIKIKELHFAWDYMKYSPSVLRGLKLYAERATRKPHGHWATVYCLTNYDTTMEENLYRIYTLRDMGYSPYVMIYDKPNAPQEIRRLQRWCNCKWVFKSEPRFENYTTAHRDRQEGEQVEWKTL